MLDRVPWSSEAGGRGVRLGVSSGCTSALTAGINRYKYTADASGKGGNRHEAEWGL